MNTPVSTRVSAHVPPPVFQFRPVHDAGPAVANPWTGVYYKKAGEVPLALVTVSGEALRDDLGLRYPEMFRHPCFYYTQRAFLYLWVKEQHERTIVRGLVGSENDEDGQRLAALAFRQQVLAVPNC